MLNLPGIMPLIEQGVYIPTIDHSIPPDVSYENFTYTTGNRKKSGSALTVGLPLRRTEGKDGNSRRSHQSNRFDYPEYIPVPVNLSTGDVDGISRGTCSFAFPFTGIEDL